MEIKLLSNGIFGSNTYIVSSRNECIIIDCGNKPQEVLMELNKANLNPKYIILTHGHCDHVFYAKQLVDATSANLCIHEDEVSIYLDNDKNGYNLFGFSPDIINPAPDIQLKHGSKLSFGDVTLEIIHTPGHTPGGICILIENALFTGDTLFQQSIGRTDLSGGSFRALKDSIINRIYTLDSSIVVYPGHGMSTTIGFERENNPYV